MPMIGIIRDFGLLVGQKKQSDDLKPGFWQTMMDILNYCLIDLLKKIIGRLIYCVYNH